MCKLYVLLTISIIILLSSLCITTECTHADELNRNKTLHKYASKINDWRQKNYDICEYGIMKHLCRKRNDSNSVSVHHNYYRVNSIGNYGKTSYNEFDNYYLLNQYNGNLSESEIKLKKYINSCQHIDKTVKYQLQLLDIAKMINGWPLLTDNWNSSGFDWIAFMGKLNGYEIIHITFCSNVIKSYNVYFDIGIVYKKSENDIEQLLKIYNFLSDDDHNIKQITSEIYNFINVIRESEYLWNVSTTKYTTKSYRLHELKEKIPEFDWDKYFENYYGQQIDMIPSTTFEIRIESLDKIRYYVNILNKTDKRILVNYMMWAVLDNLYYSWKNDDCTGERYQKIFNPIATKIFIRKGYNNDSKRIFIESRKITLMFLITIKSALGIRKPLSLEKELRNEMYLIEYANNTLNDDFIDLYYKNLKISSDNYFQNVFNLRKWKKFLELNENKNDIDKMNDIDFIFRYFRTNLYNPTPIIFGDLTFKLWKDIILMVSELKETQFEKSVNCLAKIYFEYSIKNNNTMNMMEMSRINFERQNLYDGALRLSFKVYEYWLKQNENYSVVQKENELLLNYFNLNAKQLFLLYVTILGCNDPIVPFDIINTEIISSTFNCTKGYFTKCDINDDI